MMAAEPETFPETLVGLAEAINTGRLTAGEVADTYLERIASRNGNVNAVIWHEADTARQAAAAADARRAAGEVLPPLHGVPMLNKDMMYEAGRRSTCGSLIRRDFVADTTATVVARLKQAGACTFGGLNMSEFAQGPTGHNQSFGDCRNPWNPDYITGGSSSGCGAAVAGGLVPASLGSDTGGSVRLPASCCGVTGLKPTQTRVSRYGAMPLSFSFDCIGPLARSAADCALLLSTIAGRDELDPTSSRLGVPDYRASLTGDIKGLRIGVPENWFFDDADEVVVERFEAALDIFRARGAVVVPILLPVMDAVAAYSAVASRVEIATIHAEWMKTRAHDYAENVSGRMYPGYAIPGTYYIEAMRQRGQVLDRFCNDVFAAVDLLAMPTMRQRVPTRAETDVSSHDPEAVKRFLSVSANTRPINYLGLPAVSIPCGFDARGLPTGLQLVGRPFGEARLLRAADAYQRDTDWHRRWPSMTSTAEVAA